MRLLRADEVECRVQTITEKGCSLLLFKDARVDMKILDEIYGTTGWQRTHEVINGNLFCNIDIWDDEKKCWVRKQDVGVESNTEKEKGQASDSFKRAGFNVGIGRELYTAPKFMWIPLAKEELYANGKDRNGKDRYALSSRVKFHVKEIGYNEQREIDRLVIVDQKGNIRYEFGDRVTEQQMIEYTTLTNKLKGHNKFDNDKFMKHLEETYGVTNVAQLTKDQMEHNLAIFRNTVAKLEAKQG